MSKKRQVIFDGNSANKVDGTENLSAGGGGGVSDGDYGDITVSGGGGTWNIDAGVVTTTELGGDITTAGKALLDDADAAAQRTTLGAAAASHSHAISDVTGLQTALDNKLDDSQASSFGLTLLDDADAATARATLGVVTPKRVVGVTFDGGGSTPTVGSVGFVVVPFSGTVDQWAIVADASGSAVVDVWKASGAIPNNGNTIAGTEKPTLSSQQLNTDTALSSWTTAVTAGDVFGFELESVATCTRITAEVRIQESA